MLEDELLHHCRIRNQDQQPELKLTVMAMNKPHSLNNAKSVCQAMELFPLIKSSDH